MPIPKALRSLSILRAGLSGLLTVSENWLANTYQILLSRMRMMIQSRYLMTEPHAPCRLGSTTEVMVVGGVGVSFLSWVLTQMLGVSFLDHSSFYQVPWTLSVLLILRFGMTPSVTT